MCIRDSAILAGADFAKPLYFGGNGACRAGLEPLRGSFGPVPHKMLPAPRKQKFIFGISLWMLPWLTRLISVFTVFS